MKNRIENLSLLPAEPGEIPFSFTHALASSLHAMGCPLDRKIITGASGFAFRMWAEAKTQCPSAMSIFDFSLLKTAVELCGYSCTHISRLWHEGTLPNGCWQDASALTQKWHAEHPEAEIQEVAHKAIHEAIDIGTAPVVWDIGIPEWGLIAGYDDEAQKYETIDCRGLRGTMPYEQLGKREIPILSVTIPGGPDGLTLRELAPRTMHMAINHANGEEWEERPAYENGLAAYPIWASLIKGIDQTGFSSQYYAGTYAHLRDCAAAYLAELARNDGRVKPAADAYARVAAHLKEARDARADAAFPTPALLDRMEQSILAAYEEEKMAVDLLEGLVALL